MGKKELVALHCLSAWCLVAVVALWQFLVMPWIGLQCVLTYIFTNCWTVNGLVVLV